MPLDQTIGAAPDPTYDPQSIVTGLIGQQEPDLVQNGTVDPQAVLNRLVRKGLQKQSQPQGPADLSSFGKTKDELGPNAAPNGEAPDFASFGEPAPAEPKPADEVEPEGALQTGVEAAASGLASVPGALLKGAAIQSQTPRSTLGIVSDLSQAPINPAAAVRAAEGIYKNITGAPPEEPVTKNPVYQAGEAEQKAVENAVGPSEAAKKQHWFAAGLGSGLGQMAPIVALGAYDPPAAIAAGAAMMGGSGAADTYEIAKQHGASEDTALEAAQLGGALGALSGTVQVGAILKPFEKLVPQAAPWAVRILAEAAKDGATFATIGEAQEFLSQQIARLYDPQANGALGGYKFPFTDEQATHRLLTDLATGGVLGAVHGAIAGRGKAAETGAQPAHDDENHVTPPNSGALPGPGEAGAGAATGAGPQPRPGNGGAGAQGDAFASRPTGNPTSSDPYDNEREWAGGGNHGAGTWYRDTPEGRFYYNPTTAQWDHASESSETRYQQWKAGQTGAQPGAAQGAAQETPPPFETKLNPKIRSKLEEKAAYYQEFSPEIIASWSDDKLKDYVNTKFGFGSKRADDDEILRRYGFTAEDVSAMSPEQKSAAVDEAVRNGVHAGEAPPTQGTREAPVDLKTGEDVAAAAAAASQDHSHAQGEAGNFQRGHATWNGLDLSIEVPPGGTRKGTVPGTNKTWETTHPHAYGEILGVPNAADGMRPDVVIGPHPDAPNAYVIDEKDKRTGKYKQSKAFVWFLSPDEARDSYLGISSKLPEQIAAIEAFPSAEFPQLVRGGLLSGPAAGKGNKADQYNVGAETGTAETHGPPTGTDHAPAPAHHAAIEAALRNVGVDPKHIRPVDIQRAAEIHAQEGYSPEDSFQLAVARAAVEDGLLTPEQVEQNYGPEIASLLHPGKSPEQRLSPAPSKSAAGRPAAARADERVSGRGANGAQGRGDEAEGTETATPAESVRTKEPAGNAGGGGEREADATGHPARPGDTAVEQRPGGRERHAKANAGEPGGEGASARGHQHGPKASAASSAGRNTGEGATSTVGKPFAGMIENEEAYRAAAKKRRERGLGTNHVYTSANEYWRNRGLTGKEAERQYKEAIAEHGKAFDAAMKAAKIATEAVPDDIRKASIEYMHSFGFEPLDALDYAMLKAEREAQWLESENARLAAEHIIEREEGPHADVANVPPEAERASARLGDEDEARREATTGGEAGVPQRSTGAAAERGAGPAGERSEPASTERTGTTERTAAGEQHVIPGTEHISDAERAKRAAERPLKPQVAQKAPDEGLFSDESKQIDLVEQAKAQAKEEKAPETGPSVSEAEAKPERLEDVGEKIGGARKDKWAGRGLSDEDIEQMTGAEKARLITKSNVWGKPDYEAAIDGGMDHGVAAVIKLIYDRIPATPHIPRHSSWSAERARDLYVTALRAARNALAEVKTFEDLRKAARSFKEALAPLDESGGGVNVFRALHSPKSRRYFDNPLDYTRSDVLKAEEMVKQGFPSIEAWKRHYVIREQKPYDFQAKKELPAVYRVYSKGKNAKTIGTYPTLDEAESAAKADYEKNKEAVGETSKEPVRPHLDHIERTGPDYRKGRDVKGEDFLKDFGFRGVEFGNWVAGDERQKVVNLAYDALHDLARVLNMPPKALSLDGKMALAFGARSKGGKAAAHYEPDRLVVNMTKLSGAGSLAHEWSHALDHYLGELDTPNPYGGAAQEMSGGRSKVEPDTYTLRGRNKNLPPRLQDAANKLMQSLFYRTENDEEAAKRFETEIANAKSSSDSWDHYRKSAQDHLRKGDRPRYWNGQITKADEAIAYWRRKIESLEDAATNPRYRKQLPTQYHHEAKELSGSSGDYWRRPNEMFARAFESWVNDRLAKEGHVSQYLVQGVEGGRFNKEGGFRGNPYPRREERERFNAAFDRFAKALQVGAGKHGEGTRLEGVRGEAEPEPVAELVRQPKKAETPLADEQKAQAAGEERAAQKSLPDAFAAHFQDGKAFGNILAARRFAKDLGFGEDAKSVEEAIELGVVKDARGIVDAGGNSDDTFKALVNLYGLQPRLGTRTSTSVRDQAYSTPVPLAYVASRLAGIDKNKTVFEPTAGNGALLITADPSKTYVIEANQGRARALKDQGFKTSAYWLDGTNADASKFATGTMGKKVDVVIANPPFGAVREAGESKVFDLQDIQAGYQTHEIDHAIALRALERMKDDGTAALILGGVNKMAKDRLARAEAYAGKAKREFFKALYDRYNVVDHFTVSGDLYERQGAGWPVDVVVIRGRGKSARLLPAADVPRIYNTWDEVGGLLHGALATDDRHPLGANGGIIEPIAESAAGNGGGGRFTGEERPLGQPEPGEPGPLQPRPVSGGAGLGPSGGEGQVRSGGGGEPGRPDSEAAAERRPSGIEDFDSAFDGALDQTFGPNESVPETNSQPQPEPQPEPQAPPRPRAKRAASESAKSAAKNAASAADDAMSALTQLFGGGKTVGSGLNFDEQTWAKAKPLFQQAAGKFGQFWNDVGELVRRMVDELKNAYGWTRDMLERAKPYLRRFVQEVQQGIIRLGAKAEEKVEQRQPAPKVEVKPEQETEAQVAYRPQSKVAGLGTLAPRNMRRAIEESLAALEKRVGPVDEFVSKELGYNKHELADYFGAEQIDALGLALDNIKRGKGFIIGDQTGIGKGRVNAAIIRWAIHHGRIPVFVTEKPNLYADMYRDLTDIGIQNYLGREPRFLPTNTNLVLPLDEEGNVKIATGDATKQGALMSKWAGAPAGAFLKAHDAVFTNYSQMQTVQGKDTPRRNFLRSIAPQSVLIFDESHNAGGQTVTRKKNGEPENRAEFARSLIKAANGAFYSSATYAKRPDVMDLYAATDMAMAVEKIEDLGEAIARGGIPMQQVVAAMLGEAGQYIRRERSFAGVTYDTPVVPVAREQYDQISHSLAQIQEFSKHVKAALEPGSPFWTHLAEEGLATAADNATGDTGVHSTNFTSIMHNIINQMLLSMKAKPAVERALAALARSEKPLITVANTMESFLKDYAEDMGVNVGEPLTADFSDVLKKYLDRTRTVLIKPPHAKKGETIRRVLTHEELGPIASAAYRQAADNIAQLELSELPISPIDYIRNELTKKGYRVGEITGRGMVLDYSGDEPVLRNRLGGEVSIRGRRATNSKFNAGDLDALVLNQSGATGISLHASSRFKDQRKRRMIIAQPEANVDTHMQMLGRVHRTGQVVTPGYEQLVADIPAEKRPAAVLAKKMASLNANTTASRGGALTAKDVPDFINDYGDMVAVSYLADHPEMNGRLGWPVRATETGGLERPDAMRKLTGRIPLLPLTEQEELYEHLEGEYRDLLAQMDAAGENALEAKTLDIKAKPKETTEVLGRKNESGSPFASPVNIEKVRAVRLGKPFTPAEVVKRVADAVKERVGAAVQPKPDANIDDLARVLSLLEDKGAAPRGGKEIAAFDAYKNHFLDNLKDKELVDENRTRLDANRDRWVEIDGLVSPAARVTLRTSNGNIAAISLGAEQKGEPKNPLALGTWKATFAIADASRQITLPYSRLYAADRAPTDDMMAIEVAPRNYENAKDTLTQWNLMQHEAHEDRYIATGNLLAAYDWLNHKGRITHYTDDKGNVRQGIILARDFDLSKHAKEKGRLLKDPADVRDWLDKNQGKTIWSEDKGVRIWRTPYQDRYVIATEKSKKSGGVYFTDKALTDLTGDFYSRGGTMQTEVGSDRVAKAIARLQELGARFHGEAEIPKATKLEEAEHPYGSAAQVPARMGENAWERDFGTRKGVPLGRQAQDHVVKWGRTTGDEHLILIDHKGRTVDQQRGLYNYVSVGEAADKLAHDPGQALVVHHNHPSDTGLSEGDVSMLSRPGIAAIWAHGHEGVTARGALTPEARAIFAQYPAATARLGLYAIANDAGKSFYEPVQNAVLQGDLHPDEARILHSHLLGEILRRAGILDYRDNVDAKDLIETLGLEPYIERAANEAAGRLFRAQRPSNYDRPADALRHPGDLGIVLVEPEKLARRYRAQEIYDRARRGNGGQEAVRGSQSAGLTRLSEADNRYGPRPAPGGAGGGQPPIPPNQTTMAQPPGNPWRALTARVSDAIGGETGKKMIEGFSDFSHRMRLLQNDVEALYHHWISEDGRLPDEQQFYTLKRLFPGKRADRVDIFNKQHFEPLAKFLRENRITEKQAGDYLYAKHAVERNTVKGSLYAPEHDFYRAVRDPNVTGASGMSRNAAQGIINQIERGPKAREFAELLRRVDGIRRFIQEEMLRGGLQSQEALAEWNRAYRNYVPLKEWDDPSEAPTGAFNSSGRGRGDVRGPESQYAFGRRSKADNPLAHLISQAYRTIDRAERNRVFNSMANALGSLKRAGAPIEDALGIHLNKGRPQKQIDPNTGLVRTVDSMMDRFGDNAVQFKRGGEPRYFVFDDRATADAVRRWSPAALPGPLHALLWLMNKMKSMWTHYSPNFLVRHNARYYVESVLNAMELKETGNHSTLEHARQAFPIVGEATRAIFAVERGERPEDHPGMAEVMRSYQLMKEHGGVMAMRTMRDIDQTKEDIRVHLNDLKRGTANVIRQWHNAVEWMNHVSSVWDNAQRLATMHSALKQGKSPQEAALLARDATIDYQYRGLWSNIMGLWEPFFNTALRTGFRLGGAVSRSKIMRGVFFGTLAMGLAASAWNYFIGGKDKDGIPFFDKIPSWERSKAFIILAPWIPDEKGRPSAIKFPFPYNWGGALSMGYGLGNFLWGSEPIKEVLKEAFLKPFVSMFSEIGEEGIGVRSLVPELLRPEYDIATNRDWAGRPIHMEETFQKGPNAYSGKKDYGGRVRTGEGWKDIAEILNDYSGGARNRSGVFDFYPEDIREVLNPFVGTQIGFGNEVYQTGKSLVEGHPVKTTTVPVGRVFFGQDYDAADRFRQFERSQKAKHPWMRIDEPRIDKPAH